MSTPMSRDGEVRIGACEPIGQSGHRHGVIGAVDKEDGDVAPPQGLQCG